MSLWYDTDAPLSLCYQLAHVVWTLFVGASRRTSGMESGPPVVSQRSLGAPTLLLNH